MELEEAVDNRFGGLGQLQVVLFAQLGRADAQSVFVAIQMEVQRLAAMAERSASRTL